VCCQSSEDDRSAEMQMVSAERYSFSPCSLYLCNVMYITCLASVHQQILESIAMPRRLKVLGSYLGTETIYSD
jgi:hypothetical protein